MPRGVDLTKLPGGQLKKLVARSARKELACAAEVTTLIVAMKANDFDMARCRPQVKTLTDCMSAIKRKGHKPATIHHIMRLAKEAKR